MTRANRGRGARLRRTAGAALLLAACRSAAPAPTVPAPAATAAATPPAALAAPVDTARRRVGYTEADVRFMQGMIGHHAQALAMAALVPARTTRQPMLLLAERIRVSQTDEIALMRRWLADRHEDAPAADMHAGHRMPGMAMPAGAPMPLMPGMLTPEEMARLEGATGAGFERLFLEGMIRHHEGALTMVAQLFGSPGAGQNSEIFRFASDVDADQRAEIARMRALLGALPR